MRALVDTGPSPRPPAAFNLAAYVLDAATRTPDKIALEVIGGPGTRIDYRTLAADVARMAGGLSGLCPEPGTRIALRLGNTPDLPIAFLAATSVDLVPAILSAALTPPEIASALETIDAKVVVTDPALPLPPCTVATVTCDTLRQSGTPEPPRSGDPDRPGYIVFTSGTAARPRAVLHAHRAVWARHMMWDGWYGLTGDDRVLHPGAFNWTYTLGAGLLDPWAAGATALIPADGTDHGCLPDLLRRHYATILAATPGHYRRLLASSEALHLTTLRHGLSAGEKLPETTRERWRAATGTTIHEAFGMSECSTFISGSPDRPAPNGTIGYAQPGRRIAVLDDSGQIAERGTDGHLAVSTSDPGLMLGYLSPEGLERPGGDWFRTGDRGAMDPDGAIRHLGRSDDVMNAGGVRVSPLEVETALASHPTVTECAVAEVEVKADTRVIAAFVVCAGALDEPALRAHMSERLASHKVPRLYVRVDALPRNPNGKLIRRALRDGWKAP